MTNMEFKNKMDRLCAGLHPLMKEMRPTGDVLVQLDYCSQKVFNPREMGTGKIADINVKFEMADMLRHLRNELNTKIKELEG